MRRASAVTIGLFVLALSVPAGGRSLAQTAARDTVSIDRLMTTTNTLAAPELEGRAAGSPGGAKARRWILDQFTTIGLERLNGGYEKPAAFARPGREGDPPGAPATVDGANLMGLCR